MQASPAPNQESLESLKGTRAGQEMASALLEQLRQTVPRKPGMANLGSRGSAMQPRQLPEDTSEPNGSLPGLAQANATSPQAAEALQRLEEHAQRPVAELGSDSNLAPWDEGAASQPLAEPAELDWSGEAEVHTRGVNGASSPLQASTAGTRFSLVTIDIMLARRASDKFFSIRLAYQTNLS